MDCTERCGRLISDARAHPAGAAFLCVPMCAYAGWLAHRLCQDENQRDAKLHPANGDSWYGLCGDSSGFAFPVRAAWCTIPMQRSERLTVSITVTLVTSQRKVIESNGRFSARGVH